MTRVLVLGGGTDLHRRLRAAGPDVETAALCRVGTVGSVTEIDRNQAVVVLPDGCDTAAWVSAARLLRAAWPFDAVASFSEVDQDRAVAVATDLGLPLHSPDTERWVNDKVAMRARLAEAGVDALPHRRVRSVSDLAAFLREAGPPLIVKPSRGRGSVGLSVLRGPMDVAPAYARAVDARAPRLVPSDPVAERFVEGPCLCVDTLTHDGVHHVVGVTESLVDERTRVDLAHVTPARISAAETERVTRHVRRVLTALGVHRGISNTDLILGPGGPVTLETHLRASGNRIPLLLRRTCGIDLIDLWLRQVALLDVAPQLAALVRHEGAAAVRFLVSEDCGVLDRIEGWDRVRALPGVEEAGQLAPDGTELDGTQSDFSYLGFVQSFGADPGEALARAERAVAALTVHVRAGA